MSREIRLPFRPEFRAKIESGKKTMTSRTRKYGEPGDWFGVTTHGRRYVLTEVCEMLLRTVAEYHWREEGTDSPEDFVRVWAGIHPTRGYDPSQLVWAHRWRAA